MFRGTFPEAWKVDETPWSNPLPENGWRFRSLAQNPCAKDDKRKIPCGAEQHVVDGSDFRLSPEKESMERTEVSMPRVPERGGGYSIGM